MTQLTSTAALAASTAANSMKQNPFILREILWRGKLRGPERDNNHIHTFNAWKQNITTLPDIGYVPKHLEQLPDAVLIRIGWKVLLEKPMGLSCAILKIHTYTPSNRHGWSIHLHRIHWTVRLGARRPQTKERSWEQWHAHIPTLNLPITWTNVHSVNTYKCGRSSYSSIWNVVYVGLHSLRTFKLA